MLKKTVTAILVMLCVLSLRTLARAEELSCLAQPSRVVSYAGETVSFDITTPADVYCIKMYADNKLFESAVMVSSDANKKYWHISAVFETSGLKRIEFRAYSHDEKLLYSFSPLKIRIKHLLPVAEPPIIMDGD